MALAVTVETLRTLHRIHRQLADLNDRAAAGPRQAAARTKQLEAAEAKHAALLDDVKKAKLAADQKQLQLRSAEAKILDLEAKLNACKTNREYQTLRDQIAADRMATKVLEDEILESLERIDTIRKTVPAAEAEVAVAKKALADVKAKVAAEAATIEAEAGRVRAELETVERDLPAEAQEPYRRIVKSKGADAMAAVEADSCGGCCQQITGNMLSELAMGRVVVCRSCGRLLYRSETQPA